MDTDKSPASAALDAARIAVSNGNFAEALDRYDWFFEHALAEDTYLAGVRLSYCLSEWADMAKAYPPAMAGLQQKKSHARQSFTETGDVRAFHDFVSICEVLECKGEAVQLFKDTHIANRKRAENIVRLIWNDLVMTRQWEICGVYLGHWEDRYGRALETFDIAMDEDDLPPPMAPDALKVAERGEFVRRAGNIIRVLKNTNRGADAEALLDRVTKDMIARGWPTLADQVAVMLAS